MIVRAILENPELADTDFGGTLLSKFDYFNDYRDTFRWLGGLPRNEKTDAAIRQLKAGWAAYNK